MRCFIEEKELILEGSERLETHFVSFLNHPSQGATGADDFGLLGKFGNKQQHTLLIDHIATGMGQNPHCRIRVAGVPTCVFGIVIELIFHVPAKHHITKSEALL